MAIDKTVSLQHLGLPDYRAKTDGSVWSNINNRWGTTGIWKQIRGSVMNAGYIEMSFKHISGKRVRYLAHQIILLAFTGPCPPGMECRHLNGNKQDNRLANLQWGTRIEQCQDRAAHGTLCCGEKHPLAKFKQSDIPKIHELYAQGTEIDELADMYNTSNKVVRNAMTGKTYKNCQPKVLTKIRPKPRKKAVKYNTRGNPRLTEDQVRAIRESYIPGTTSQASIAAKFGVTQATVSLIIRGDTWKHCR